MSLDKSTLPLRLNLQAKKSFLNSNTHLQETNECKYNGSLVALETRYHQLSAKALAKIVRYNKASLHIEVFFHIF